MRVFIDDIAGASDPYLWILGPLLALAQIAAFVAAWRRVHHGDHLAAEETMADVAPLIGLAILFLLHPYEISHPDSAIPLVAAYVFLAAVYATFVYGSLSAAHRLPHGPNGRSDHKHGAS